MKVPGKGDWDNGADHYSKHITRFTSLFATDLIYSMYDDIQSATTILDIGCGTGAFGLAYIDIFPDGIPNQTIIFTDISQGMLTQCQNVLESKVALKNEFQTKFVFQVEDATTLDGISDDSIDAVVSIFAVFLIENQESTMKSIQRVLHFQKEGEIEGSENRKRSGGVLGLTAWTNLQENTKSAIVEENFGFGFHHTMEAAFSKDQHHRSCEEETEEKDCQPPPPSSSSQQQQQKQPVWKSWFDPANIRPMIIEKAKFETVEIFRSIHSVAWQSTKDLWDLFADNPLGPAGKLSPDELQQTKQRFIQSVVGSGQYHSDQDDNDDTNNSDEGGNLRPVLLWTASNLVVTRGVKAEQEEWNM